MKPLTGISLLFLFAGNLPRAQTEGSVRLLEYHLELARGSRAYVHLAPEAVTVYVRAIQVKRLPVTEARGLSPQIPRLSRVGVRTPGFPLKEVVVRVGAPPVDPSDTVSSLQEIVGVDDMPDTFSVELADGSVLFVTSTAAVGFVNGFRRLMLRGQVTLSYLWKRAWARPARLIQLKLESPWARHLYWLLQEDLGVIY